MNCHRMLILGLMVCMVSGCLIAACTTLQEKSGYNTSNISASPPIPIDGTEKTSLEPVKNSTPIPVTGSKILHSSGEITGRGTIIFQDIEGGFFGVLSDDGHQYLPEDIPRDLQVNGTRVSFVFKPVTDRVSIFMWGDPVAKISLQALNDASNTSSSIPYIEYEKAGGIATSYESLLIYSNQRGEVRKWNQVQVFNLTNEDMKNIRTIVDKADFGSLNSEYKPSGPTPNAVTHIITTENKTIKCIDPEIPGQVVPVIALLNDLLEKHTVSPIIANMTLDGTAWRLISYLRSDNILIQVQNNTHISAIFGKDGRVTGSSGCNSYSGTFNQTGTSLSFGPVSITRMACTEPGAMEIEKLFLKHIKDISMVTGKERLLSMNDANNTSLLVFELMKG